MTDIRTSTDENADTPLPDEVGTDHRGAGHPSASTAATVPPLPTSDDPDVSTTTTSDPSDTSAGHVPAARPRVVAGLLGYTRAHRARTGAVLAAVVLLAAAGVGGAVLVSGPPSVSAARVENRPVTGHPSGFGTSRAGVEVPLVLGFRATVATVAVQVGQHVSAGDPLLTLDSSSLGTAAQTLQVKLQADQAAVVVAQVAVDAAAAANNAGDLTAAQARLAAAQSRVTLDTSLIDIAQSRYATMSAPVTGVVSQVNVVAHSPVGATDTIVQIVDATHLSVSAPVPLSQRAQIAPGQAATVSFPQLAGVELTGTVTGVDPVVNDDGQSVQVQVDVANDAARPVPPGAAAFVRLSVTRPDALAVPSIAVLDASGRPTVWVIDHGRARQRQVDVGVSDGVWTEITAGLAAGDYVSTSEFGFLHEGEQVEIGRLSHPNGPGS